MVSDQQVKRLWRLVQKMSLEAAAAKAGMDPKTARKYLWDRRLPSEMVSAMSSCVVPSKRNTNVRRTLFKLATSGRNPGVTMYWVKRWGGWSEKGKTPEPVDSRPTEDKWTITVDQPPRTPEQEQMLREGLLQVGGCNSEPEEWEEYRAEDHVPDRSPPSR